jgi:hypothetical protein
VKGHFVALHVPIQFPLITLVKVFGGKVKALGSEEAK